MLRQVHGRLELYVPEVEDVGANGRHHRWPHIYHHAYECDFKCVEYAEVVVNSEALIADLENLDGEVPDPKKHTDNFEQAEATKTIPLDPNSCGEKVLQIGSQLEPK
jgi:hypothetical protein